MSDRRNIAGGDNRLRRAPLGLRIEAAYDLIAEMLRDKVDDPLKISSAIQRKTGLIIAPRLIVRHQEHRKAAITAPADSNPPLRMSPEQRAICKRRRGLQLTQEEERSFQAYSNKLDAARRHRIALAVNEILDDSRGYKRMIGRERSADMGDVFKLAEDHPGHARILEFLRETYKSSRVPPRRNVVKAAVKYSNGNERPWIIALAVKYYLSEKRGYIASNLSDH